MTMTNEQKQFVEEIASKIKAYAKEYNVCVVSPILAQAILESGWNTSTLSKKYFNYFGMKCGSAWRGRSVNLTTKEEYTKGSLTTIKDNFRVYSNMNAGVKGYFEFTNSSRYANLKGVTDPETYLQNIKKDGYATSSKYVLNCMNLITKYNLTDYDFMKPDKDIETIAREVIAGQWGNMPRRKQLLLSAGYDYEVVRKRVNDILRG